MMMKINEKKKKRAVCIIAAGLWLTPLTAQICVSPSLKEAIDSAIAYNSQIRNQDLELEKSHLQSQTVKNKSLPQVSATAGYAYMIRDLTLDIPTITLPATGIQLFEGETKMHHSANAAAAGVTARQVLYGGGQIRNGAKALDAKNRGTDLMNQLKKDEVIKEVISSFDQIRLIERAEQLVNESETRLLKESERVNKAISAGLAIPYDRDKIKLATLTLDAKKEELAGKKTVLFQKINTLTGFSDDQIKAVVYDPEPILIPQTLDIQHRNELKAMDAFKEALAFSLKKENGTLLPTLGAFASASYASLFNTSGRYTLPNSNETLKLNHATLFPSWTLGLLLKWDIFSGLERKYKIEGVKLDQRILENRREDAERMMNLQLKNNLVNYNIQLKQLEIANQKEKIAGNNLNTADKQYKLGLMNITDRLSAETDIFEISLEKIQALLNQRQAAIDAYAASGSLIDAISVK